MTYRVGVLGTGDPDSDGDTMAYRHAAGCERTGACEIVASGELEVTAN